MSATKLTNREHWEAQEQELAKLVEAAVNAGGEKAVERLSKQGKQPVRNLIAKLIDPGTEFFELSTIAGFGMDYPGVPDIPGGGVVYGIGKIHGNWTMILGNDPRVKAGTYFPITLKKHMRAQAIAERCGLNCVYVADSGGAFLPMQAEIFPDDQQFGSMFFNMARMSAMGLKQITLSTGGNTAGGAYIVFMACQSVMIDKMAYSFLGGPPLVKAATGEDISAEDLGGAKIHTQVSGGADHLCKDQEDAVSKVREILSMEPPQSISIHRFEPKEPKQPVTDIYDNLPANVHQGIKTRTILKAIADDSEFLEYKKEYAKGRGDNIITGKIRLKGIPVGVIASNNAGIIFVEAARKATEWIVRCSQEKIPLLFIQASPGYMVGSQSEHMGIGKYGADMVRAVSCAQVPRIQIAIGPDNGAANYGMCGRAYKPHFLFHTMRSRTSVMSGRSAAFVLLSIEERKRAAQGNPLTEEEKIEFQNKMIAKYDGEAHPFYCGARLLSDKVLCFSEMRDWLAMAFEVSLLKPIGDPAFGNLRF
ncbi:acyl-CoA carboxylase subunit beta [Desulfatibacillum aliphaticivorans]|uniref:Propionyl-CoA carboxylase, beta subunit n=1 Tax=Desulfatibacillum aliphaticivorans TaxID=218208 RepID=B8FC61_DESAL|nr:carboxyl transferase domain-containing protein [Desulfatibacillum aliphaticivorans]ACL05479.1 Propionyl-CoA carboxylase, beta subunit [Desulfatibacillum aliphaticivorans]